MYVKAPNSVNKVMINQFSVLRTLHKSHVDQLEHSPGEAPICPWYRLPVVQGVHARCLQVSRIPFQY